MQLLKDDTGETWELLLTVSTLKRIRDRHQVDLMQIHVGTPPLGEKLTADPLLMADLIFTALEPLAKQRGITRERFDELMGGEALGQALVAFWSELTLFFRKLEAGLPTPPRKTTLASADSNSYSDSPASLESTPTLSP